MAEYDLVEFRGEEKVNLRAIGSGRIRARGGGSPGRLSEQRTERGGDHSLAGVQTQARTVASSIAFSLLFERTTVPF